MTDSVLTRFAARDPRAETVLELAAHYEANSQLVPAFGYYLIAISLQDKIDPNLASKLGAIAFKLEDVEFALKCFRVAIASHTDPVERDKATRAISTLFVELGFKVQSAEPAPFELGLPPLMEVVPGTRHTDGQACLVITDESAKIENGLLSMADSRTYRGIVFRFSALARVAPSFNADLFLLCLIQDFQPALILFRHGRLTNRASDPRVETLMAIKEQTEAPVIGLYYDIAKPSFQRICRAYMTGLDGVITLDRPMSRTVTPAPETILLELWTPLPSRFFRTGTNNRPVEIGFVGRSDAHYVIGRHYLAELKSAGVDVTTHGLSFDGFLTTEAMAEFLRSCKIVLNFSSTAVISPWEGPGDFAEVDHVKGRVFEAIACGALLFESRNEYTSRLFQPSVHYVEFSDPEDLKKKLAYYLSHDDERETIAKAGNAHYQANYTGAHYWKRLDEMVGEIVSRRETQGRAGGQDSPGPP